MSRKVELTDQELFLVYQMLRAQQEGAGFESSPVLIQNMVNELVYKLSDPVEDLIREQDSDEVIQWWERKAK